METRLLVGLLAALTGFAAMFAASYAAVSALIRRRAALAAQGDKLTPTSLISWRMRNGYVLTLPLARWLVSYRHAKELGDELRMMYEKKGQTATTDSIVSVLIAWLAVLALIVLVVFGNVVGAFACIVCVIAVLVAVAGNERDKRNEAVREEIPNALESMGACFGSGFTLLQTFEQVSKEIRGPLGGTFARCAHVLETGGSAEEALEQLREGTYASELAFVAVALDVQHQSGGTIRQVLASATDAVKGTLALRRALRVQTAQARLSARVVVVMPFILVAAFSLASPDFLTPFFTSVAGYALLGLAGIMQVAGIMLVRHALSVEGVA